MDARLGAETVSQDQLWDMTPEDFSRLSFGVIELDTDGMVVEYNAVEAQLSKRSPSETLGANFWTEVAPCTDNDRFRGSVDALLEPGSEQECRFEYRFEFPWGHKRVRIRAVRSGNRR